MTNAREDKQSGKKELLAKTKSKLASLRYGRQTHTAKLIAVTGVHGKSTVVRLVAELLRESGAKVVEMMAGNGVPRSFETDPFLMHRRLADASRQGYDYIVLEVHAALIASHVAPSLVIDTLVATEDSPELHELCKLPLTRLVLPHGVTPPAGVEHHNIMTFGTEEAADMRIAAFKLYRKGTELSLVIDQHTELEVASYLVGEANAMNIATALATVYVLGVDVARFAEGVARVERIEGNYDYLTVAAPYAIAVDHGGTAKSLPLLLSSARQLARRRLIAAVDMPLTAAETEALKTMVDRLIVVGDGQHSSVESASDHEEAAFVASRGAKKDDLVLLIGQRYTVYDDNSRPLIEAMVGGIRE